MTIKYDPTDPLAITTGENEKANKVLNDYALMGVARSFQKLIDRYKQDNALLMKYTQNPQGWDKDAPIPIKPPSVRMMTFATWSKKYTWMERVETFDALERQKERKEFEADRLEWKRRRLDLLKGAFGKAAGLLAKIDPKTDSADLGEVVSAIKTISEQMRIELGENTPALLMNLDFDDPNIPLEVLEKIIQGDVSAIPELLSSRNKNKP